MAVLTVFLGLIGIDQFVVMNWIPNGAEGQSQGQQNRVKVEQYLYAPVRYRCVVVGSSMSARIAPEYLPRDFYNLALMGEGALTGLELVSEGKALPSCVLVEVNDTLLRGTDQKLIEQAKSGGLALSGLRIFRTAYEPVTLLGGLLKSRLGDRKDSGALPNLAEVLTAVLKPEQDLPDPEKLKAVSHELLGRLNELSRRGVRIFLFDPPRAHELLESPRNREFQKSIHHFFQDRFTWIDFAQDGFYITRDGVHLDAPSAQRAAQVLVRATESPEPKGSGSL